jgi:hypothetical protein
MPREYGVVFDGFYAGLDGAATFVSQYENQWCTEHGDAVFNACQSFVGNEVTGNAYGEKITSRGIKCVFGCDARVRATQYGHEGILAGNQCFALVLEVVGL